MPVDLDLTWFGYSIVALIGGFLVTAPFVSRASWLMKRASVKLERFGIEIGTEGRTLIILAGGMIVLAAGYFIYRDNKAETTAAIASAKEAETRYNAATEGLRDLMIEKYNLEIHLDFEGVDYRKLLSMPPVFTIKFRQSAHGKDDIIKDQELKEKGNPYNIRLHQEITGIYLQIPEVQRGGWLQVVATHEEEGTWIGELTAAKPIVTMRRTAPRVD